MAKKKAVLAPVIRCAFKRMVKVSELKAKSHPKNRNVHSQEQLERLGEILEYQGIRRPVQLSTRSGYVVVGHAMILAAALKGFEELPVDDQDFESEEQEYAHVQADNAIAGWAELNLTKINTDLIKFDSKFNLDLLGLRPFQIDTNLSFNANEEWKGMPEFKHEDKTSFRHVIVHFVDQAAVDWFFSAIKQSDTGTTKTVWIPPQERMDTEAKRY